MAKTVLVLSVGSLVGQTMLDCLEGRRSSLRLIGINSVAAAAGNFRCDRAYLAPPAAEAAAHRRRLLEVFDKEKPDLVIPGRDDDVLVLAEIGQALPQWAGHLLVGSIEAARIMNDKIESARFAAAHGLPFADTVCSDDDGAAQAAERLLASHGFPLIAKPRDGNGSRGIFVLLDRNHLARALARPGMAIQPYYDPPDTLAPDITGGIPFFWAVEEARLYAVQTLIDRDGRIGPACAFVSTMVAGRCERLVRRDDPALLDIARAYAKQIATIGWRGPFNLQLKRHGDDFRAIEMNGRFSGGTSARRHLGFDEVAMTLNDWFGEGAVPPLPGGSRHVDVITRSLCDFPLPADGVRDLETHGFWSRQA